MLKLQPTVIIGVGPSGKTFLEYYKQRVADIYGELPAIKLLAIDTIFPDTPKVGGAGNDTESMLSPSELLELEISEEIPEKVQTLRSRYRWLPEQVETMEKEQLPWNETRAAVRAAFHNNYTEILRNMEFHFQKLTGVATRDVMGEKGFDILNDRSEVSLVVAGSVGEVAGSALLLDVTYMSINIFRRAGQQFASTGILFVPPVTPSDPLAEALSYATLKEINYAFEGQKDPLMLPNLSTPLAVPPFNRGCFVVDSSNEKNLNLGSQEEVIKLSAEWLFRTMLTPLKGRIDDIVADQYIHRNQNRTTAYGALGLAMTVLPVEALIEWSANCLGNELLMNEVLASKLFRQVATRLSDFYNSVNLRPDTMIDKKLDVGREGGSMKKDQEATNRIAELDRQDFDRLPSVFEHILRFMQQKDLPAISERILHNAQVFQQEFNLFIQQEINEILRVWPQGGLSLAMQFLQRQVQDFGRFSEVLKRREAVIRAKNSVQGQKVQAYGSALQRVVACKPSIVQWAFSVIGLLSFAGLFSVWLYQSQELLGFALTLVLFCLIWFCFIGGAVYGYHVNNEDIQDVRNKTKDALTDLFQGEVNLRLVQSAGQLYVELAQIVKEQIVCIGELQTKVRSVATSYKHRLSTEPLCGEMGFALQTSVLSPELIDEVYDRELGVGGSIAHLQPLLDVIGTIDTWQNMRLADLEKHILNYGRRVFERMRQLRVENLLAEVCPTRHLRERKVAELYDKAAPLLAFDKHLLGTEVSSVLQTFVGIEKEDSEFYRLFMDKDPTATMEVVGDPHSFIVTSVRGGLPLFSLNRIKEFRGHYLEFIRDNVVPMHLEDEVALAPDLLPVSSEYDEFDSSMLFAVGLALGLVRQRQDDQCYGVFTSEGRMVSALTKSKINSVVLISANETLFKSLSENVQKVVSELESANTVMKLNTYLERPTITSWERKQIEKFIDLLQR